jgi:hypothetical protein
MRMASVALLLDLVRHIIIDDGLRKKSSPPSKTYVHFTGGVSPTQETRDKLSARHVFAKSLSSRTGSDAYANSSEGMETRESENTQYKT